MGSKIILLPPGT